MIGAFIEDYVGVSMIWLFMRHISRLLYELSIDRKTTLDRYG